MSKQKTFGEVFKEEGQEQVRAYFSAQAARRQGTVHVYAVDNDALEIQLTAICTSLPYPFPDAVCVYEGLKEGLIWVRNQKEQRGPLIQPIN